jgi:cation diffusion facilitator family transporter
VLLLEGAANICVLLAKAMVGWSTGSLAVISDAIHSLTDLTNNIVALLLVRFSSAPPDREHPYGHRKFETLAVFCLATLLTVLAFQIALRAVEHGDRPVSRHGWGLVVMVVVLVINITVSAWEGYWARRLNSDLLRADARHTMADILVTLAVILGWQLAARGYVWLDTVFALGVAVVVLFLAYGLFRRVVPILVDRMAAEPEALIEVVRAVPGVCRVRRIRSRWVGSAPAVDVIVTVRPQLSTLEAHAIADAIEARLEQQFAMQDVTVHIEPEPAVQPHTAPPEQTETRGE